MKYFMLGILFTLVGCSEEPDPRSMKPARYAYLVCKDKKGVKTFYWNPKEAEIKFQCRNGNKVQGYYYHIVELYPVKEEKND